MTVGSAAFVVELNELTALKQVHVRVLRKIHGIGHSDKQIISEGENLNINGMDSVTTNTTHLRERGW